MAVIGELTVDGVLAFVHERKSEVLALLSYLDARGFREAPASSKFHLCAPGGLVQHSLNVTENLLAVNGIKPFSVSGYSTESCAIVALFHDCYKCTDGFDNPYYVDKFNKDGARSKIPYARNKATLAVGSAYKSALIVSRFVPLSEDELQAIFSHDGLFCEEGRSVGLDWSPLAWMLHFADFYAGVFQEGDSSKRIIADIGDRNNAFFCLDKFSD
ncbi:MAG TPA: hypothetical protein ENH82_19810 [bacterium]|nr:hypothetical protein [bacterium]